MTPNIITAVNITEDVTLATVTGLPQHTGIAAEIFGLVAVAGINVDMITIAHKADATTDLSFTLPDHDVSALLLLLSSLKGRYKNVVTNINSGNIKLTAYGEKMRAEIGVAARLFTLLDELGVQIKLVSTSEVDISVLTDREYLGCIPLLESRLQIHPDC